MPLARRNVAKRRISVHAAAYVQRAAPASRKTLSGVRATRARNNCGKVAWSRPVKARSNGAGGSSEPRAFGTALASFEFGLALFDKRARPFVVILRREHGLIERK